MLGTIDKVDIPTLTVYLNLDHERRPIIVTSILHVLQPSPDPYASKLTNLWYSWAQYYQDLPQFKDFAPKPLTATVSSDTDNGKSDYRILTFSSSSARTGRGDAGNTCLGATPFHL